MTPESDNDLHVFSETFNIISNQIFMYPDWRITQMHDSMISSINIHAKMKFTYDMNRSLSSPIYIITNRIKTNLRGSLESFS